MARLLEDRFEQTWVIRSLAEFCLVLDTALAVAIVIVAVLR